MHFAQLHPFDDPVNTSLLLFVPNNKTQTAVFLFPLQQRVDGRIVVRFRSGIYKSPADFRRSFHLPVSFFDRHGMNAFLCLHVRQSDRCHVKDVPQIRLLFEHAFE